MRVTRHPTWIAGREDPGDDARRWVHAALWLDVELPVWSIRRREHLHLAALEGEPDRWSRIDISAVPMRPAGSGAFGSGPPSDEVIGALHRWLDDWTLEVHRHPGLGMVSSLGERQDEFQRRLLSVIRPEVQRRIRPHPPTPDRPRGGDGSSAQQMARGIVELGREIESRAVRPVTEVVRRAEVGIVLTPVGLDLRRAGVHAVPRPE